MNHNSRNPFLFACGVPRSGTTLLQRMLDNHPELAVANDSHFIPRALELTDKSLAREDSAQETIPLSDRLVDSVREYHRFYRMGISEQDFESACQSADSYQQLVTCIYDCFARNAGKPLAGEKTPDYVRRLKLLNSMFPNAKLIHLIRDGRNVALSLMQWATPHKGPGKIGLWNDEPVAVCALWWRWLVMQGAEQAAAIEPSAWIEIRYESLTETPASELQKICQFLQLPYSQSMVEYHRGKSGGRNGQSAKKAWLRPTTGLRNWQNDMTDEQVELFEALAADALQRFGYELRHTRFSPEILQTAAECNRWWKTNFLSRHQLAASDHHVDDPSVKLEQSGVV